MRHEFAYVAENLLLRGGYWRTHFQADQTTLQSVSQMGSASAKAPESLDFRPLAYTPAFVRDAEPAGSNTFSLSEKLLQASVRQVFSQASGLGLLSRLLGQPQLRWQELEALGEKALEQGHVDILLKEARPVGVALKVPVEVKLARADDKHVGQVKAYMKELGGECIGGLLVASGFTKKALQSAAALGVTPVTYTVNLDLTTPRSFDEITIAIQLQRSRSP